MSLFRSNNSLIAGRAGTTRSLAVQMERVRTINADPEDLFAFLANPSNLANILPRVNRVEILKRQPDRARIATHMAFGPFGSIRTEGDVTWTLNREVRFSARHPVVVDTCWTLQPAAHGGTTLRISILLDLEPILGPMAAMVPREHITGMVEPDLEHMLTTLAYRYEPRAKAS